MKIAVIGLVAILGAAVLIWFIDPYVKDDQRYGVNGIVSGIEPESQASYKFVWAAVREGPFETYCGNVAAIPKGKYVRVNFRHAYRLMNRNQTCRWIEGVEVNPRSSKVEQMTGRVDEVVVYADATRVMLFDGFLRSKLLLCEQQNVKVGDFVRLTIDSEPRMMGADGRAQCAVVDGIVVSTKPPELEERFLKLLQTATVRIHPGAEALLRTKRRGLAEDTMWSDVGRPDALDPTSLLAASPGSAFEVIPVGVQDQNLKQKRIALCGTKIEHLPDLEVSLREHSIFSCWTVLSVNGRNYSPWESLAGEGAVTEMNAAGQIAPQQ
jgi:hypothetical protein